MASRPQKCVDVAKETPHTHRDRGPNRECGLKAQQAVTNKLGTVVPVWHEIPSTIPAVPTVIVISDKNRVESVLTNIAISNPAFNG